MMSTWVITAGILLLIVLPVLRVLLMLIVFVRERDFRFGAIAMLVLAIILLGAVLGVAPSAAGRALEFVPKMTSRCVTGALSSETPAVPCKLHRSPESFDRDSYRRRSAAH
jgi:hypothetical protein